MLLALRFWKWLHWIPHLGVSVVVDVPAQPRPPARVADFPHAGRRIIAFLADDAAGPWPQLAERYAAAHGLALAEARWYEMRPQRFVNGRPHVSEYRMDRQSWRFETDMELARAIVQRLGFDPDTLPLDI